jgi:hypothetical protein
VAALVAEVVTRSVVRYAEGGDQTRAAIRWIAKLARMLPGFRPRWNLRRGIEQLHELPAHRTDPKSSWEPGICGSGGSSSSSSSIGSTRAPLGPAAAGARPRESAAALDRPSGFQWGQHAGTDATESPATVVRRFRLIISDNASTDATGEIARAFAAADPRVRYLRNSANRGLTANFNRVFALGQGELFNGPPPTISVCPEYLAACVAVLDAHPDVVLAYGKTEFIDADGRPADQGFLLAPAAGIPAGSLPPGARLRRLGQFPGGRYPARRAGPDAAPPGITPVGTTSCSPSSVSWAS